MSTGGQIDCYTLPNVTSGDVVEFTESSIPRGLVVNASGSTVCSIPTASCSLGNGGPWLVLVFEHGREHVLVFVGGAAVDESAGLLVAW